MKPYTLTNREGESISPMTSARTVFDANGTDIETRLDEQKQSIETRLSEAQNELGELSQMLVDYEDDAALALSDAEARLGRRIDAVGILPFNSIVEAHGSVSDGAPDYETQFPPSSDGAYRHVIFDKSRRTFLWEIHAGDYPNCPAGDAYSAWTGSEEYVSEGHPRADRLYRLGNELYRWDGTALVSYSDTISAAKYASFDMQWTAAGGTVIESGKTYGCNGLTDITYEQALYIYRHTAQGGRFGQTSWKHLSFRTNLPIQGFSNTNEANEAFRECTSVEIINLPTTYGKYCRLSAISRMFQQCVKLEAIIGAPIYVWNTTNSNVNYAFYMCHKLKEVRIVWDCNCNISFSDSPLLSYDTIEYFITNATNTAAITITLHPDAYARVTEEIFSLAAEKNITIATT